jgi:hypothetical protein
MSLNFGFDRSIPHDRVVHQPIGSRRWSPASRLRPMQGLKAPRIRRVRLSARVARPLR